MKRIIPKEFYAKHKYCPICGNDKLYVTLVNVIDVLYKDFFDDTNKVMCDKELAGGCGWEGIYLDLVNEGRKTL